MPTKRDNFKAAPGPETRAALEEVVGGIAIDKELLDFEAITTPNASANGPTTVGLAASGDQEPANKPARYGHPDHCVHDRRARQHAEPQG